MHIYTDIYIANRSKTPAETSQKTGNAPQQGHGISAAATIFIYIYIYVYVYVCIGLTLYITKKGYIHFYTYKYV